ncbi:MULTISPECIES: CU044_5270 family protein [unclassified Arthrobacter]|uniref:CU044_5270 family protein n=1 Tax=unclassified Arthrobacter TaxID=235627 RepID=UPI001E4EEC13|nr:MULTISPECIES: CU044_5270 family protein [unclassified Arthrobacter]MCC9144353.1 CU044_5270 family protein [Arthrobacter sp. zg-Y919]MDK1275579.1 CU044_5270 family protein [Arthrobacter sp. zg.Y919]WIB03050.1 CU044_5270 family protein [Arthrobacter sp. zg-Y919]
MDELHLLRATRNTTGTVTPAVLASGREKLMQRAADESAHQTPAPVLHPVRPWRRTLFASAAAVALVATLVAVDVMGSGERPGATAEADRVLDAAATAAVNTSDPVVQPGQYLKINTTGVIMMFEPRQTGEATYRWLASLDRQMYVPADRTGEWVWTSEPIAPVQFFGEGSRQASERMAERRAFGMPMDGEVLRAPGGQWGGFDWQVLNDISLNEMIKSAPLNPDELLNMIYEQTKGRGWNTDAEAFTAASNILRTGVIPANLRAALYEAIALIPGVTVVDREATLDGRTGVSLGMKSSNYRTRMEIIIDPESGQMIGEREVQLREDKGVPAGTVTRWTAITTSVVDSAP